MRLPVADETRGQARLRSSRNATESIGRSIDGALLSSASSCPARSIAPTLSRCHAPGSTPTDASPVYTQSIELTDSATINCLAIDAAGNTSAVFSQTYTIAVAVNVPPIADAGIDLSVSPGETAYLDGSASSDPDDGPEALAVGWRFVSLPAGSELDQADIYDAQTLYPYFQPDTAGDFVLELTVQDGQDIVTDQVTVSCTEEIQGDLDGDADIDVADYTIFIAAFGRCAGDAAYNAMCDFDGDNCITFVDYQIWYGFYLNQ